MQRKLVQMGKHCLMAAIPMKWIKQHNLVKGEHINFEEVEQYLLVSPSPLPKNKEISIMIENANKTGVFRILSILYDSGFKSVNITYDTPQTLTWLLWSVNALKEWKLDQITNNKCSIKTISIEPENFDVQFRKIMLLTKDLLHTYKQYISGERELSEDIRVKHQIILSGTQSIKRMINTSSLPLEYKYYYFIAIQLEEIADHCEYLMRTIETQIKIIPSNIYPLQEKLAQLFDETYDNFFKFNLDWFIDLSKKEIWKSFATEKNPLLVYHLRAISERIKNIAKYTVGIRIQ